MKHQNINDINDINDIYDIIFDSKYLNYHINFHYPIIKDLVLTVKRFSNKTSFNRDSQ